MTRYIYIDSTYKDAFFKDCKKEQQQTLSAIGTFMSSPDTDNEKGVEKKVILNGVTREDYKKYAKESESIEYDDKRQENWMSYISMFLSAGDTSLVEFEEDNDDLISSFKTILKGDNSLDTLKSVEDDLWQSYILCDLTKEQCNTLEQAYGVSFIRTEDDVTKHEPDACFLRKENHYDWNDLVFQKKSNSIVILDQYAFHDANIRDTNIIVLLEKIVCRMCPTHITIFTHQNKCLENDLELIKNKVLSEFHDGADVHVDVQNTKDEFHDRLILTNNQYITIGGGFDALKPELTPDGKHKSIKNTTLHVYSNPAISSKEWLRNEYYGYLNAISETHNQLCQTAIHTGNPEPFQNRIMRPITEIRS